MKMWKLIFDVKTKKGTGCNREPEVGEFSKELPPSECAWFNVYPERYVWNGAGIEEVAKPVLEAMQLADRKIKRQNQNKASGKAHVFSVYPIEIQSSAWGGLYIEAGENPDRVADGIREFIKGHMIEENRVFDLIETAKTLEELDLIKDPIWPEV